MFLQLADEDTLEEKKKQLVQYYYNVTSHGKMYTNSYPLKQQKALDLHMLSDKMFIKPLIF